MWQSKKLYKKEVSTLPKIIVREGEGIDEASRRFKKIVNRSGILSDCKKHEAFYPKSLRRKMKSEQARRKAR